MEKNIKNPIMIMLVVLFIFLVVFMGTLIGNQSLKSNFIGLDSSHLPTIEVREREEFMLLLTRLKFLLP